MAAVDARRTRGGAWAAAAPEAGNPVTLQGSQPSEFRRFPFEWPEWRCRVEWVLSRALVRDRALNGVPGVVRLE
jgi:hypothetical protein